MNVHASGYILQILITYKYVKQELLQLNFNIKATMKLDWIPREKLHTTWHNTLQGDGHPLACHLIDKTQPLPFFVDVFKEI